MEVPTNIALSVDTPRDLSNPSISNLFLDDQRDVYVEAPWWVKLSVQLNAFDKSILRKDGRGKENGIDMTAWINSLPRKFDTPIHWPAESLQQLHYPFLQDATDLQRIRWKKEYETILQGLGGSWSPLGSKMSYEDFVWGCECARSRAFSGSYSGSAFNPATYALTLLLVTLYVGLNLGTLEQAANGAALVLCATILKDFVIPKFLKQKRYVICPVIDMANHVGTGGHSAEVAFEYLRNAYSLSMNQQVSANQEVFISYGARSNDQLLQYFGFVELDNPHDVYVMPSLRQWDIEALEKACGQKFGSDRLVKLERAGLLGQVTSVDGDDDSAANRAGGVVISRAGGVDPAVLQALRALVSTDEEWKAAGEAIGNFATEFSGGKENERLARLAAKTAFTLELESKPTTLKEDEDFLQKMSVSRSIVASNEEHIALIFRIEKKKLLQEIIASLK